MTDTAFADSAYPHYTSVSLKPKDLLGIPWRVAFALQADGWYLRSDIIWSKPNPMPESVTDRPTKSHEYLFLLSKQASYHYDAAAIQEQSVGMWNAASDWADRQDLTAPELAKGADRELMRTRGFGTYHADVDRETRNKRSVWTIPTMPYAGAHFATMPEALVEPCVLAGCPLGGLVLDPFLGSGTVGFVAERLGRRWVGTDLSYQPLAQKRTAQRGIRFEPEEVA
jgi:DNA modification methylase